jgi:malate synthase
MTVAGGRLPAGVEILGPPVPGSREILTPAALDFLAGLQWRFGPVRQALLARRIERQAAIDAGASPGRLPETVAVREDTSWQVAEPPPELADRRVEITGPAEPKMMINALNSGARVFMADLEDALSPTWANVVGGQLALHRAVRDELTFEAPGGLHRPRRRPRSGQRTGRHRAGRRTGRPG